jgi:FkbM family methyltransferase
MPKMLGGAQAMDKLLQDEYSKHPVELRRTHGFDIYLDTSDLGVSPSIGILGWYELRTTELFVKLIKTGWTVVDVGANVGFFTLLAAKLTGEMGRVISFEPDPTSYNLLSKSVERNHFGNVSLFQRAISGTDGDRSLHLSATHHKGLHSITRDLGGEKITVQSSKLDTIASKMGIGSIDLLKIDVEGAEPEVLEGAGELLAEGRIRNIIMEWEHAEIWAEHRDILHRVFSAFDSYRFARSIPFLPSTKLDGDNESLFSSRLGANLYLHRRSS